MMLLADAIKRSGVIDRKRIRDAIANTRSFKGVTGTISFNENGDPIKSAVLMEIRNGQPLETERHASHVKKIELLLDTIFQHKKEDIANEMFAGQKRALALTLNDILKVEGIAAASVCLTASCFYPPTSNLPKTSKCRIKALLKTQLYLKPDLIRENHYGYPFTVLRKRN